MVKDGAALLPLSVEAVELKKDWEATQSPVTGPCASRPTSPSPFHVLKLHFLTSPPAQHTHYVYWDLKLRHTSGKASYGCIRPS